LSIKTAPRALIVGGPFFSAADELGGGGPMKTSLGELLLGRPKTASPSPPRLVQARLNSQSGAHCGVQFN
jgi:hypothetical protein